MLQVVHRSNILNGYGSLTAARTSILTISACQLSRSDTQIRQSLLDQRLVRNVRDSTFRLRDNACIWPSVPSSGLTMPGLVLN
jgi:hypothetical protein